MSRTVTPATAHPAQAPVKIAQELIAKRAYEKWLKRGMQHGCDFQDWVEAETELRSEMTRSASNPPRR